MSKDGSHIPVSGSLQINDLGYFSLEQFASWEKNGIYHLSRLSNSVNVYLSQEDDEAIDLPRHINKNFANCNIVDLKVFIGANEKLPIRLVIYRLPQEVVSERRRKANAVAKKKGRTPTQKHMQWLEFAFFITNVPQEVWQPEIIGTIYRIRWQIELIFKSWKSLLNIDILKGTRPERIQCIIYARLLCIVLITNIYSYASAYAWETSKKEVSFHKVISMLLRKYRVIDLLNNPSKILLQVEVAIARLCKQKRKRKTTLELIEGGIGYLETLDKRIQLSADMSAAEKP